MRITLQDVKDRSSPNGEQGFWYLASPYTAPAWMNKDEAALLRNQRAEDISNVAGWLKQNGLYVFSPIWNCHREAMRFDLPLDFKWWQGLNRTFIRASVGVIVAQLPGWKESAGIRHEVKQEAAALNRPVIWLAMSYHTDEEGKTHTINRWDDEEPIAD